MFTIPLVSLPRDGSPVHREMAVPGLELGLTEPFSHSEIALNLQLTRREKSVLLKGKASCQAELECGRCLEHFQAPVDARFTVEFEPTEAFAGQPEELEKASDLLSVYDGHDLPVGEEVRQELELALPLQPVCKEGCRGLCAVCGGNLNRGRCLHGQPEPDPAFTKLGDLLKAKESKER